MWIAVEIVRDSVKAPAQVGVVPAGGGSLRPVPTRLSVVSPGWLPDGRLVVWDGDLYAVQVDGTGLTRLTHGHRVGYDWELRGATLAYARDLGGRPQLYSVQPDGSALRRLALREASQPAASAGGGQIAFMIGYTYYLMRSDGTGVRRLARAGGNGNAPSWSPDGKRVLVTDGRGLAIVDVRTRHSVHVRGTGKHDAYGDWSPDGRRLAFARLTERGGSIYVVGARGGRPRLVRRNALHPAWSPDGRRIAFDRPTAFNGSAVWTMRSDGSGARRVSHTSNFDANPEWSPDGRWLLFASLRGSNENGLSLGLMRRDGSAAHLLRRGSVNGFTWLPLRNG
jgi:Tol biopolymer transport system component